MNGERSETGSGPTAEQEGTTLDDLGGSETVHIARAGSTGMSLWGAGVLETRPKAGWTALCRRDELCDSGWLPPPGMGRRHPGGPRSVFVPSDLGL